MLSAQSKRNLESLHVQVFREACQTAYRLRHVEKIDDDDTVAAENARFVAALRLTRTYPNHYTIVELLALQAQAISEVSDGH